MAIVYENGVPCINGVPVIFTDDEPIKDMADFQRRYFPIQVGKVCPYCRQDITVKVDQHSKPYK